MTEKPNLAILKRSDALRLRELLGPTVAIYALRDEQDPLPPGAQAALKREEERGRP